MQFDLIIDGIRKLGILIVVAVFIVLITGNIIGKWNTEVQSQPEFTNESREAVNKINTRYMQYWDYGVLLFVVGVMIISAIFARNITLSPAWIGVTFILMAIGIGIAMVGSNIYESMISANADLMNLHNNTIFIPYIMNHLVLITIIDIILVSILMFTRGEQVEPTL